MGGHGCAVAASLLERLLKLLGNRLRRRLLDLTLLFAFTFFFTFFAITLLFTFRLILNLRIHNVRIGGLGANNIPCITVVSAVVIVVEYFKVSAVLHHEVLVVRVVRTRVDGGTSGVVGLKSRVNRGIPAIGHIAVHAAPRSTRIKSKRLTHLIVDEDAVIVRINLGHFSSLCKRLKSYLKNLDHHMTPDGIVTSGDIALEAIADNLVRSIVLNANSHETRLRNIAGKYIHALFIHLNIFINVQIDLEALRISCIGICEFA